ncbi:MAG: AAA family ATPase [Thermaerobacter sp.]|nr:AAA family ATPase [Thermaerobacter sp.]MDA8146934.1 AAA family ATPase [Thermaerobacter sp.]
MGKVVAVANQKGGVGKTTTVINLGAYLADARRRVLAVDSDPQGNTTAGLGVDKAAVETSIYQVLLEQASIVDAVVPTAVADLHLVPATLDLAGAEIELVGAVARETRLRQALQAVRSRYDFLLVDCPPSLGLLTLNALTAADSVLIPIQCEYYALEGLSQLMHTVRLVQKHLNPQLELEGVLLTMFDGRTNLSIQVVDEVKRHFRGKVYQSVVPRNVRLAEAPSHGLPILRYDPRSRGAEVYRELAAEVMRGG